MYTYIAKVQLRVPHRLHIVDAIPIASILYKTHIQCVTIREPSQFRKEVLYSIYNTLQYRSTRAVVAARLAALISQASCLASCSKPHTYTGLDRIYSGTKAIIVKQSNELQAKKKVFIYISSYKFSCIFLCENIIHVAHAVAACFFFFLSTTIQPRDDYSTDAESLSADEIIIGLL